jgi:hypothetical protein
VRHVVLGLCLVLPFTNACARASTLPAATVVAADADIDSISTEKAVPQAPQRDRNPAFYEIPEAIGPFVLSRTSPYEQAAWGTMYRYRGPDSTEVDVFLYQGPDFSRTCDSACARNVLAGEWRDFLRVIPDGVQRGYFEELRVLNDSTLWPAAGQGWRMGHGARMKMTRRSIVHSSVFQLHYYPSHALKTRATYVPSDARTRLVDTFNDNVGVAFRRKPQVESPLPGTTREALLQAIAGRWSWTSDRNSCSDDDHSVRPAADGSKFFLRFKSDTTGAEEVTYVIERSGPGIIDGRDHVIRASIVGETRLDDAGRPVVWDLILLTGNRYTWHRADWPADGETGDVIRCNGAWPVEPPQ